MTKEQTYKLALLGNPVSHSFSPQIHQQFATQAGIKISYERILVEEGQFRETANRFLEEGGLGFNITVPCKQDAWRYVTAEHEAHAVACSPPASQARAVNTICFRQGRVEGDNTDGPGLARDLVHNLGWQVEGARVLVLGAGGAVSGVLGNLLALNPAAIDLHNRTHAKAVELAQRFDDKRLAASTVDQLGTFDIIINGTGASLAGEVPALPPQIVSEGSRCYDMMYGAEDTPFMRWCRSQADCEVADGLGMLVEQAALSFKCWLHPPEDAIDTAPVIASMRASITNTNANDGKAD